jgi:O-antigen/teichoic acid export membrane protein
MSADPSLRRDILSAYAASIARVLSWVIVSALVYRRSPDAFAMLALVRGTLGILNYCSLGLLPAMIQMLARIPPSLAGTSGQEGGSEGRDPSSMNSTTDSAASHDQAGGSPIPLAYASPRLTPGPVLHPVPQPDAQTQAIFATGTTIALLTALAGALVTLAFASRADTLYRISSSIDPDNVALLMIGLGSGFVFRWWSEPAAALLQARGAITTDNCLLAGSEALWVLLIVGLDHQSLLRGQGQILRSVGLAYGISGGLLVCVRNFYAGAVTGVAARLRLVPALFRPLLVTGLLITLAQLADYLYAPTDFILINRLLAAHDVADYAPAIQIDAGLMILVTGLASVLLPKAAIAHAAGNRDLVRRYYVRGTLASALLLAIAAILVWIPSPLIFKIWFGNPMDGTRAILPLVLCHTIIGGSSAVGRSILLALGRTKPFTVSVLLAGFTNVAASYAFARYLHLGLAGIVLGTIVAVVARCAIWMPWYILRELRHRPNSRAA